MGFVFNKGLKFVDNLWKDTSGIDIKNETIINKSLEEIRNNLQVYVNKLPIVRKPEGYINENYVYDENKTVKWNREHREELIKKYNEDKKKYKEENIRLTRQFKVDLIYAAMNDYGLNESQAKCVYDTASRDNSSTEELIDSFQDYLLFVQDLLYLDNEEN